MDAMNLLELIDDIDRSQFITECDVLSALSETYQKTLVICKQSDDPTVFYDNMFMESKDNVDEIYHDENGKVIQEPRSIRSQNIIAKLIRLIKRIWQRILTMISSVSTNATVNKLKSYIKKASTEKVPSVDGKRALEFYIKMHDDLAKNVGQGFDHSPIGLVMQLRAVKTKVEAYKKNRTINEPKSSTTEFVSKELMIKYLDSYQNYIATMKSIAKDIDKYLDEHYKTDGNTVYNDTVKFAGDKLSDQDIQLLNDASTILFEELRLEMDQLKRNAQQITNQFGDAKQPRIEVCQHELTMTDINNACQKLLMGAKTNTSTKDYRIIVADLKNIEDPKLQQFISSYHGVINLSQYKYVIGTFLDDVNRGDIKNWRILGSNDIDDNVRQNLGDKGLFIFKN